MVQAVLAVAVVVSQLSLVYFFFLQIVGCSVCLSLQDLL
jgi:hypothetical protein